MYFGSNPTKAQVTLARPIESKLGFGDQMMLKIERSKSNFRDSLVDVSQKLHVCTHKYTVGIVNRDQSYYHITWTDFAEAKRERYCNAKNETSRKFITETDNIERRLRLRKETTTCVD